MTFWLCIISQFIAEKVLKKKDIIMSFSINFFLNIIAEIS